MNKNTLLALGLILLTMMLFTTPQYTNFYYNFILRQKSPIQLEQERKKHLADSLAALPATTAAGGKAAVPAATGTDTTAPAAVPPATEETRRQPTMRQAAAAPIVADSGVADSAGAGNVVTIDTVWVKTPVLRIGISTLGARIVSVKTLSYAYSYGSGVEAPAERPAGLPIELMPADGLGGANLRIDNASFDSVSFSTDSARQEVVLAAGEEREIRFTGRGTFGLEVTKTFLFRGDGYRFECMVAAPSLNGKNVCFGWQSGINESEVNNPQSGNYDLRSLHYSDGKAVEHVQQKKPEHDEPSAYLLWAGVSSKYFLVALGYDKPADGEVLIDGMWAAAVQSASAKKDKQVDYRFMVRRAADGNSERFWVYAGPSQLDELQKQKARLEGVLFTGWKAFLRADLWFPPVCEAVLWLLIKLQAGLKDYGVVIIVLTILVRLVTFPLTQSSTRSMSRMKDLQPKINAIRARHKSNPRKMNEEIMAMYKAEGVNPFNPGCLPIFLQMPVFIALFIVLRKAIELRGAQTVLMPWVTDLSQPEAFPVLTPLFQGIFPGGVPLYGCTVGILPFIMAALTFVQNKMTIKDPNQKAMIYIMPVFMLVLFNNFSSGLVLYWTVSSLLGIIQQWFVERDLKMRAARQQAAGIQPVVRKRDKGR